MQIGEVAERTGLSLRTIRHYEEVGLVVPQSRTQGGFRLYTQLDVDRLNLVKRMKPLGLALENMRDLLAVLDPTPDEPEPDDATGRLAELTGIAERRCDELRSQLRHTEELAGMLRSRLRLTRREHERDPV
ncbi:MerR family transcriptional regulator [Saccharomonospora piscinae]|uniref:MerR family transcriptional regulator n=1 Tax=Saccharomonospora piscinae TaxID=687388 RepID=A0A1V9ADA4_SACPI|nr:MerR family transcriptional regulator [Saccharomonospora piscinae]TLW95341.1 MerR family transcriptional regulator [Saccharomonospora piscinae]